MTEISAFAGGVAQRVRANWQEKVAPIEEPGATEMRAAVKDFWQELVRDQG
ncbi:MAG: hypothetical protein WBN62_08015 [Thermoanaerobaculia bacterium]